VLKKIILDNLIFLTAALVPYVSMPAIVAAQERTYTPEVFTETLSLSRGRISPAYEGGAVLNEQDYCALVVEQWGWKSCASIDAFLLTPVPGVDTVIAMKPNTDGHVSFKDWKSGDLAAQIQAIETELKASVAAQAERRGQPIAFVGWRVYPTLREDLHLMYFASDIDFGGEVSTNIKATLFDRKGYIEFSIVPLASTLSPAAIEAQIHNALAMYKPIEEQGYAAFKSGDKVAAVGAVGVLAGILGVKYGKVATGGLIAMAILLAKKGMIFILLPALWGLARLKRLFMQR
jgi:uncharacterized membrane-anchored protein